MVGFITQIHILASFVYSSDESTIFIYVMEPKEQLKHQPNVLSALKNKYLEEDSNNETQHFIFLLTGSFLPVLWLHPAARRATALFGSL